MPSSERKRLAAAAVHFSLGRVPPKSSPLSARLILRGQAVGFAAIIAITWIVELLHVPHLWFGEPKEFVWFRVLSRSLVVIGIWLVVHLSTRRLLRRLHELEDFLLICSWCRKVGDHGSWVSFEQYFNRRFDKSTSHGICPECADKQLEAHRRYLAERVKPRPADPVA